MYHCNILLLAVFQSIFIGKYAEDGGVVQHVTSAARGRVDAAHPRESDQRTHRLAQQGISVSLGL